MKEKFGVVVSILGKAEGSVFEIATMKDLLEVFAVVPDYNDNKYFKEFYHMIKNYNIVVAISGSNSSEDKIRVVPNLVNMGVTRLYDMSEVDIDFQQALVKFATDNEIIAYITPPSAKSINRNEV